MSIAIILIVIIGFTSKERIKLTGIEKTVGNIISPVQRVVFSIGRNVSDFFGSIKDIFSLKKENERLELKILELEDENRRYEDLIGKSEYLVNEKELLDKTNYNLITAQVIGKDPSNWFNRFTVDKGMNDGVNNGDTVVQAVILDGEVVQEGIIGRVTEVGDNWAKVNSIIDENNNISFKVIRTQDGGIISGNVEGKLSGYLFDSKADVMKGDKLFSSGLGEIYAKDLYIGEITDVIKEDNNLIKKIEVEPAVDFKKIYKVFIISNN